MESTLLVLGAGPKGLAIAAKAIALHACYGFSPRVVLIDKNGIAPHWTGKHGYTDGRQALGTPPSKDLGFPYNGGFGKLVDRYVWENFSWQGYLVDTEDYSGKVDRGSPQPTHGDWANYLHWAWKRIEKLSAKHPVIDFIPAEVTSISPVEKRWQVSYKRDGTSKVKPCDGVVISGPGEPKSISGTSGHPCWLDGWNFWLNIEKLKLSKQGTVGIIGSGETAASIAVALVERIRHEGPVHVLTRRPTIHIRGEGHFENTVFTDPDEVNWTGIEPQKRWEFIERTDRSVFSVHALDVLKAAENVKPVVASYLRWEEWDDDPREKIGPDEKIVIVGEVFELTADEELSRAEIRVPVELAINATGFNEWWFTYLLEGRVGALMRNRRDRRHIIEAITDDLSIPSRYSEGKLHLPMLSAFSCGPGLPNLSCLGRMADKVLSTYVEFTRPSADILKFPVRGGQL